MKRHSVLWLALGLSGLMHHVSAQDEAAWGGSAGISYLSRYTAYGIDLSEAGAAAFSLAGAHRSGFVAEGGAVTTLGAAGEFQNWHVALGYERTLLDVLTVSAELTHYEHANDTANVLSALGNSFAFGAEVDFGNVSAGISYDTYLGSASASYVSFDLAGFFEAGRVYVVPLIQATIMSQEVADRFIKSGGSGKGGGSGGGSGSTTIAGTTVSGLSSISLHAVIIVPVVSGLNLSVHPYYLYSPKSEVSTESSRVLWTAGIRYSMDL